MLYLPPGEAVRGPAGLGVAHVTLHQSLRSVFHDVNTTTIAAKCRLADDIMRRLGVARPERHPGSRGPIPEQLLGRARAATGQRGQPEDLLLRQLERLPCGADDLQ